MTTNRGKTSKTQTEAEAPVRAAEIVREYGPFNGAERIHGVTHDGRRVWAATGPRLVAFDPDLGPTGGLESLTDVQDVTP